MQLVGDVHGEQTCFLDPGLTTAPAGLALWSVKHRPRDEVSIGD